MRKSKSGQTVQLIKDQLNIICTGRVSESESVFLTAAFVGPPSRQTCSFKLSVASVESSELCEIFLTS